MSYRTIALIGGLAGIIGGYLLTHRAWGVVAGVVVGMIVPPIVAGASARELGGALFLPVAKQRPRRARNRSLRRAA